MSLHAVIADKVKIEETQYLQLGITIDLKMCIFK